MVPRFESLAPLAPTKIPLPVVVMVPELVMAASVPVDSIPVAKAPRVVMVPELVLVMVALAPAEAIPFCWMPLVSMHPLLVTMLPIVVDVMH
jgi:hypothetical protein